MTSINGVSYILPCCTHRNFTAHSATKADILKHKIEHTWNKLCIVIKNQINSPVKTLIQQQLDKVDQIEATADKPIFISSLRRAFASSMSAIKEANLNPEKLPKQVALQLTAILARFGMAIYANKDVQHPFQSSLDVMKAAILMQKYAFGLSMSCPDLSQLLILDDLYSNTKICQKNSDLADKAIDSLNPYKWAAKTLMMTEKQQLLIPELLRYTQGAMGYLDQSNLHTSSRLLETAEAVLVSAQKKGFFNQMEVNNFLAELKYNNITSYLADKIKDAESQGKTAEAEETKQVLSKTWEECVTLSKDPEKMRARCNNKRIFIENMSLENQLASCKNALNGHLSLPRERQDVVLIALANHNVSHLYHELKDDDKALHFANAALVAVIEAKEKGENNVQFDSVIKHAQSLAEWHCKGNWQHSK
ncbi:MAG TPA: hypothetical protein VGP47_06410 [Parachlamydiaceae bacterium]|nr:hypothetical protein [Parachlamydiaceae bacterium]